MRFITEIGTVSTVVNDGKELKLRGVVISFYLALMRPYLNCRLQFWAHSKKKRLTDWTESSREALEARPHVGVTKGAEFA